jgi:serine/threonine-protein kinase
MPTAAGGPAAPSPRASSGAEIGRLDSSSSFDAGGFAPGAVIAERYRVIGLLGRGGMGEVYRADDLKLGQSVALKFLPPGFSKDAVFLDRFRAEVRNARQVSHPNVCRVYDIGEVDGHHFLSMEYVDGENLATLLRRIGRLPGTKALEIARQLCAGLAAAHAQGVLHRDIKPSNVMIDGHGRAKLTDFGLAVRDHEAADGEVSGTPAYMAPEQIAGRGATIQSDLYSLGLVLYEIYTGKKTFEASSFADWRRAHTEEQPTALSHHAADIDAAVERAILRCLEKDPTKRPASATELGHSLSHGLVHRSQSSIGRAALGELLKQRLGLAVGAGERQRASCGHYDERAAGNAERCGRVGLASRTGEAHASGETVTRAAAARG